MDTDYGDSATASTATLEAPAAAEPEVLPAEASDWTAKASGLGRAAAGLTRGLLFTLFMVVAPIALLVWAVLPRLMSPAGLADQAIDVGLTETLRVAIVDQLASELADRQNAPVATDQMRSIFDRSLSQDWFDQQVTGVAGELELWFAGADEELPPLQIDLVPSRRRLLPIPRRFGWWPSSLAPTKELPSPRVRSPAFPIRFRCSPVRKTPVPQTISLRRGTSWMRRVAAAG